MALQVAALLLEAVAESPPAPSEPFFLLKKTATNRTEKLTEMGGCHIESVIEVELSVLKPPQCCHTKTNCPPSAALWMPTCCRSATFHYKAVIGDCYPLSAWGERGHPAESNSLCSIGNASRSNI